MMPFRTVLVFHIAVGTAGLVLGPIAAGSYAFAFVGYVAAKRRWPGWVAAPR